MGVLFEKTSTHSGSLRNYTIGVIQVIQVTLLECKMRLNTIKVYVC